MVNFGQTRTVRHSASDQAILAIPNILKIKMQSKWDLVFRHFWGSLEVVRCLLKKGMTTDELY